MKPHLFFAYTLLTFTRTMTRLEFLCVFTKMEIRETLNLTVQVLRCLDKVCASAVQALTNRPILKA